MLTEVLVKGVRKEPSIAMSKTTLLFTALFIDSHLFFNKPQFGHVYIYSGLKEKSLPKHDLNYRVSNSIQQPLARLGLAP